MKELLITTLRNKDTSQGEYRSATEKLALCLAMEASPYLVKKKETVNTPLGPAEGHELAHSIVLVPVLRAGLALLYPFMRFYPNAKVGFIGVKRDEETAEPHHYYTNIPPVGANDDVIVLEPMLATGGSSVMTVGKLVEAGVKEEQILFISVIAAPEGIAYMKKHYPKVRLHIAQIDKTLNEKKFIVPGLGDFGDRYFGTVSA